MRSGPTVDPFTWKYGGSTFFSLFIAKPDHMQMTTCILSILRYTKPSRFPPSSICPLRHIYYSRRQRYPFDMYSTTRLSSATAFTAALSSTSSPCSRHLTMNNLIAIQASHPVSLSLSHPSQHSSSHFTPAVNHQSFHQQEYPSHSSERSR